MGPEKLNTAKKFLDRKDVEMFCRSMAVMLKSGISVNEAASLLASKDAETNAFSMMAGKVAENAFQGKELWRSMEAAGTFPAYCVRTVQAGESSGNLEKVLAHLADYYHMQDEIAVKVRGALLYPFGVLAGTVAVLAVMCRLVMPAFTGVYESLAGGALAATYKYVRIAEAVCGMSFASSAVACTVAALLFLLWRGGRREAVMAVLGVVPACRETFAALARYRFTASVSVLLASGMLQDAAVQMAKQAVAHPETEKQIDACAAHMEDGHGFAWAACEAGLFDPVHGRMLLASEHSGNLDQGLLELTYALASDVQTKAGKLSGAAGPLVLGFAVTVTGLSMIGAMLPLIGMMNAIG